MSRRRELLEDFVKALGAEEIVYSNEGPTTVEGTVIYDPTDPEERQDFCWRISEKDIPSRSVYELVKLLNEQKLLDIDKIILNRSELVDRFNSRFGRSLNENDLIEILTELGGISVDMVDDGELSDRFFIHE